MSRSSARTGEKYVPDLRSARRRKAHGFHFPRPRTETGKPALAALLGFAFACPLRGVSGPVNEQDDSTRAGRPRFPATDGLRQCPDPVRVPRPGIRRVSSVGTISPMTLGIVRERSHAVGFFGERSPDPRSLPIGQADPGVRSGLSRVELGAVSSEACIEGVN